MGRATKERPARSRDELRSASVHVHYEWFMLMATAADLCVRPRCADSIYCALIESFTVHARALHHFFWPAGFISPADVLASDYFPGGVWPAPTSVPVLADVREDVASFIVHLSYNRPAVGGEKQWRAAEIAMAFDAVLRAFRDEVERLDPFLLDAEHWASPHRRAEQRERDTLLLRETLRKLGG